MSRPDSELCGDPHSEGLDDPPALGQLYRGDYPALEAFVLLRLEVIGVTDKHSGAGGALLAERELVDRVVKIGRVGSSACLQEGSAPRGIPSGLNCLDDRAALCSRPVVRGVRPASAL